MAVARVDRRSTMPGSRPADVDGSARRRPAPWSLPAALAAASAAARQFDPATSTWMSPPSQAAAPSVVSVALVALSCSAMTRMAMSDHPGFVLELVDQFRDGADLDAGWRLGGSATFNVFRRGATSTPRSAGSRVSSSFFLAFMMLGSEA